MWQHQPAFRAFFEAMANRYRFIQFDGRGMGLSSRGLGPGHTLEDRLLDFEAVVERLNLDRVCLIAPNAACHVAVPYAIDHPERVDALVLWNPGWKPSESGTLLPYEELVRRSWELFVRTNAENFSVGDPELDARRVRESSTPEDFIREIDAVRKCSLRPVLPSLKVPTLILGNRDSPLVPTSEALWRGAAGLIRDSRVVLVDDGGQIGGLLTNDSGIPPAATAMIDFFEGLTAYETQDDGALRGLLSTRELEVLRLVAFGKSSREIGEELVLSRRTVERHVANIYLKTQTHGRAQLATYALRNSLT
jgi:DNA-binding CsgD family transcriptional regulator